MANLSMEEFNNAVQGKGIDDVISEIKKLPTFALYKTDVKTGGENTAKTLEASTLLMTLGNDTLRALITAVSMQLLFALADQKLRAEILGQEDA